MNNVTYKVDKDVLTITVNLKERHDLSGSGNTITIGSTQGAVKVGVGDIAMNVSVYTKEGLAKKRLEHAKDAGYKTWEEFETARKAAK